MRFLMAILAATVVASTPQTPQPTYLDTLEVRITNLDVVVTDKHGTPVRGLKRDDFEVRENGAPQPVTNFSEFNQSSDVAQAEGAPAAVAQPAPEPPPARKIVFFIDDMTLHPEIRHALLKNAQAFVDKTMRDGDEAMVVTPDSPNKVALMFTGDRTAIHAAVSGLINRFTWRTDTPYDSERFFFAATAGRASNPNEYREAARMYALRVRRRVNGTLRTLLGFVGAMADIPGRKVIVIVSASLTAEPGHEAFTMDQLLPPPGANALAARGSEAAAGTAEGSSRDIFGETTSSSGWSDLRPMIREIGATAAANGITIYSVQPDMGVHVAPPGGGSDTHSGFRGSTGVSPFQREIVEGTAVTLGTLAGLTGGKFFQGGAQIGNAFTTLTTDTSTFYSLGYRSPAGTNDTFRKVEVVVKGRPELAVRTHQELLRLSPARAMDELVASTLYAPRDLNELGIEALAKTPLRELDHYKVDIAVKIPMANLTFVPAGNVYRATFSLHYAAADGHDYATGAARAQTLQVKPDELDEVRKKTYTYVTTLVIAPGTAQIAVGVVDELSRQSSLQRLTVQAR
jgi:VWFA-related protein